MSNELNNGGNGSGGDWISNALNQALSTTEPSGLEVVNDPSTAKASNNLEDAGFDVLNTVNPDGSDKKPANNESPQGDSTDTASSQAEGNQKTSSGTEKEFIVITDESGKRRKVEVDYSNREAVKKAFTEAAGMRKFQAERDKTIQARKELEKKLSERESDWQKLEEAYKKGPEEVFDRLSGTSGAFQQYVQKQLERQKFLENASPEEIKALEANEKADKTARELAQIREENEKFRKEMLTQKEEVETKALESKVHPIFDKYRFADKLDSPEDEQVFDEMLWNSALKRLEPYEQEGLDITPELVDREFRAVSGILRKRIGLQAEKKADKVIAQKKNEAKENVQSTVMSGYKSTTEAQQAKSLIESGDLAGVFRNWGKLGNVFKK